jgi:hypothetical protein
MSNFFRGKNWNLSPLTKSDLVEFAEWRKQAKVTKIGDRYYVAKPDENEYVAADWRAETPVQALRCVFWADKKKRM